MISIDCKKCSDLISPAIFYCTMGEFFLTLSRKVASMGKNQTIMVNVPSMALMGRAKNRVKSHFLIKMHSERSSTEHNRPSTENWLSTPDGFVKSPSVPLRSGIALHPSLLRRTTQVRLTREDLRAGSRETRESFLLCHPDFDILRVHQLRPGYKIAGVIWAREAQPV
jgi:hypothetical protein